ncbi:MAG: GNAT family N-acetyltransferase [Armatimonadota bacterium]
MRQTVPELAVRMLSIAEITDTEGLRNLEPTWRELASVAGSCTVFQTYEWNHAWLKHMASGRLWVLTTADGAKTIGIAPFVIRRCYGLPSRRLQFAATGPSDYLGVLAEPGREAEVWHSVLQHVICRRDLWDVVDLQQIPDTAALRSAVDGMRTPGLSVQLRPQAVCPYLPLGGSREAFLAKLGGKTRWNLRYYERVLKRTHDVAMELVPACELESEMENLFRLHSARWRARLLPGVLALPAVRQFHRNVALAFAQAGWLRLFRLRLDDATVASLYCFSHNGRGYYYLGGFDPRYARFSIGTLLTGYAIGELAEEGCSEIDFLRGREAYKYRWGCLDRTNLRLTVAKRGVISKLAAWQIRAEQRVADAWESRMHAPKRSDSNQPAANPTRNMER